MPRISICPACGRPTTIPEGIEEAETVRCPECGEEFPLSHALSEAARTDPSTELPEELWRVTPVAGQSPSPQPDACPAKCETGDQPAGDVGADRAEQTSGARSGEAETSQAESGEPETFEAESAEEVQTDADGRAPDAAADARSPDTEPSGDKAQAQVGEARALADQTQQPPEASTPDETEEAGRLSAEAEGPPGLAADAEDVEEEAGETAGEAAPGPTDESADQVGGPAEAEVLRVRCPCCEAEYELSQAIVVATGAPLGHAAAALTAGGQPRQLAGSVEPGLVLDVWRQVERIPQIDTGRGPAAHTAEADAEAFDFAQEDSEAADAAGGVGLPRRRRKQKSVLRGLAGWLLGGLGGLFIAYYVLNVWKGERFDKLPIPLPGVPHTYKHSPDWFPSWLKPPPDSEETPEGGRDVQWPPDPSAEPSAVGHQPSAHRLS